MLSVDTETKGLDQHADGFRVFSVQWADADHEYFCTEDTGWQPFLNALADEDTLIFANASFDIHALREGGIIDLLESGHRCHDVQTLARAVIPGRFQYKLEGLGTDLLGRDATVEQEALREAAKRHKLRWNADDKDYYGLWKLEPELMARYGKEDVRLTWDLWRLIWARATPTDIDVYKMEITGVAPILRAAERDGVLVDKARLASLKAKLEEQRDELRYKLLAQGMSEEALGAEATDGAPAGKASSNALLADLLRIGVPLYRKTPKSGQINEKTGKRAPDKLSVNKDALREFEIRFPVVADLVAWRSRCQILRTFIVAMEKANPRIHTSFSQAEARTGRMCVAEGSLVEAPRNLLLQPCGIPIEHIQVGQYVYSHGADGVPRPKRVLAKWCTGNKKVLRLIWRASGSKSYLGELRATPDHRVRMEDGGYKRLDELRPDDKLAYLGRSMNAEGRSYITWSGDRKVYEHRHLLADAPLVHHINGLKYDNRVENLQGCADASEHGRLHAGALQRGGKTYSCPYTAAEFRVAVSGGIKAAMREYGHDYLVWQRWALDHGIAIPDMRRREKTANHRVVMVMSDGESVPCWDLEIEDTPCFVANEIAVHNSASRPNMQNLPRVDEDADEDADQELALGVRRVIVPERGNALLVGDYTNIEVYMLAHYIADDELIADLESGMDMYARTAARVYGYRYEDCVKGAKYSAARQRSKTTALTAMYGGGAQLLSTRLGISTAEAAAIKRETLDAIPGYWSLDDRVKAAVRSRTFPHVVTICGRRLYVPRDKDYVALNTILQGSSAEIMKLGMIAAAPAIARLGYAVRLVVHDELVAEGPACNAPQALVVLKQAMESVYPLRPALKVSGDWSIDSYADAK